MSIFQVLLRITFCWLFWASTAWAYVDPGSGMLVWQGLIAGIGAVLVFLRNPIQVIKSMLNWIRRK